MILVTSYKSYLTNTDKFLKDMCHVAHEGEGEPQMQSREVAEGWGHCVTPVGQWAVLLTCTHGELGFEPGQADLDRTSGLWLWKGRELLLGPCSRLPKITLEEEYQPPHTHTIA